MTVENHTEKVNHKKSKAKKRKNDIKDKENDQVISI